MVTGPHVVTDNVTCEIFCYNNVVLAEQRSEMSWRDVRYDILCYFMRLNALMRGTLYLFSTPAANQPITSLFVEQVLVYTHQAFDKDNMLKRFKLDLFCVLSSQTSHLNSVETEHCYLFPAQHKLILVFH